MNQKRQFGYENWLGLPRSVVLIVLVAIFAFLLTEHSAHVFGILPYLLLLACPLLHMFMHGSHSKHGASEDK